MRGIPPKYFSDRVAEARSQSSHELREYVRYRQLGYESGTPADPEAAHTLWNNAHTATLEDYGLPATPSALYHPEAERYIPK